MRRYSGRRSAAGYFLNYFGDLSGLAGELVVSCQGREGRLVQMINREHWGETIGFYRLGMFLLFELLDKPTVAPGRLNITTWSPPGL